MPSGWRRKAVDLERQLHRSLAFRLAILILAFTAVPVILFTQFQTKDKGERLLLLESVLEQGRLIAQALEPMLRESETSALPDMAEEVARLVGGGTTDVRVLFRPAKSEDGRAFFYVAASPAWRNSFLEAERSRLEELGVLDKLVESCEGHYPVGLRYTTPAGQEQIVTSITAVLTKVGCWAVVTSHSTAKYLGSSLGLPYWRTPEVQVAGIIYIVMVVLVLSIYISLWHSLHRFSRLARDIRQSGDSGTSFAVQNKMPALAGVAAEFDHMVTTLQSSADSIRRAAEENAHAFKSPIAVIRQCLEPLKPAVFGDPAAANSVSVTSILQNMQRERGRRAMELIESALDRLDELVSLARRMDETTADFIDPPRERVDLASLLQNIVDGHGEVFASRSLRVVQRIDGDVTVRASDELLETVIENILGNAIEFSPPGSEIRVSLAANGESADLTVEDQGPGVPPQHLQSIFERYFSRRTPETSGLNGTETHYGIGLWIVRRNIEAVGGSVTAENCETGGLRMRITFPSAA